MDRRCFLKGKAIQEGQGLAPPPASSPCLHGPLKCPSLDFWGHAVPRFLSSSLLNTTPPADQFLGTNYLPDHPRETPKAFPPQSFHPKPEQGPPGSSGLPLAGAENMARVLAGTDPLLGQQA